MNGRFLLATFIVVLASPVFATISRVQGNYANLTTAPTSGSVTLSAITSGNTVVGCVNHGSGNTLNSVSDGTNTYTIISGPGFAGDEVDTFYKENVTGGPTTITATFASGTNIKLVADEFSGISTSASTDGNAEGTANDVSGTNSFTSGNLSPTPTHNGDLIYGCEPGTFLGSTLTDGTGFTGAVTDNTDQIYSEYLIQATAGTVAVTFTPSAADYGWINGVAFQAAAGAALPPTRALMGVGK